MEIHTWPLNPFWRQERKPWAQQPSCTHSCALASADLTGPRHPFLCLKHYCKCRTCGLSYPKCCQLPSLRVAHRCPPGCQKGASSNDNSQTPAVPCWASCPLWTAQRLCSPVPTTSSGTLGMPWDMCKQDMRGRTGESWHWPDAPEGRISVYSVLLAEKLRLWVRHSVLPLNTQCCQMLITNALKKCLVNTVHQASFAWQTENGFPAK